MKRRPTVPDEALWHAVARTVEPLARAKKRVAAQEVEAGDRERPREAAAMPRDRGLTHGGDPAAHRQQRTDAKRTQKDEKSITSTVPGVRPKAPVAGPPPLAAFERRKARRIASGTIDIEARIDLHGLRQSEAHLQLTGFIRDCLARGLATVLVITGKGGRREQVVHRAPSPRHPWDEPWSDLDAHDHGVLRRSVPMWLAEPGMRAFVVSFTEAGPRHGGSGALYVHLRRRLRSRAD